MRLFLAILVLCLNTHCNKRNNSVKVAAASSTQFVMDSLIRHFEETRDCQIDLICSSSGKLYAQILEKAPFDIFISADSLYPKKIQNKLSLHKPIYPLAKGKIVLWSGKSFYLPHNIASLSEVPFEKIAIPDPKIAPYGKTCVEYLKAMGIYEEIKHKIIWTQNVGQVNQFVESNHVDLGFSSLSSIIIRKDIDSSQFHIVKELNQDHTMILLNPSKTNDCIDSFYNYLQSEEARNIFAIFGLE